MNNFIVRIKLLGNLMWYPKGKKKEYNLKVKNNTTIKEIIKELGIPLNEINYVSVNGRKASLDTKIRNNDHIEVIPSIGGG